MHQERHIRALHGLERGIGVAQISHTRVAVGGGAGRIELDSHDTSVFGAGDLVGRQLVGQVQRHQRLKVHARRHGGQNARAVGQGLLRGGHRWLEVGHDHGAAKLGGGVRHHGGQRLAVAQVHVPVVGAGQGQGGGRGGHSVGNVEKAGHEEEFRRSGAHARTIVPELAQPLTGPGAEGAPQDAVFRSCGWSANSPTAPAHCGGPRWRARAGAWRLGGAAR